jgi:3-oxoacyl-(acyl-carrier-protein) synthase
MTMKNRVVITGHGVISPLGESSAQLLDSLLSARSGISLWQSPDLRKTFPAGVVPRSFVDEFPLADRPYLDRTSQMAILAARQALTEAGLWNFEEYGGRAGLWYGTVRGGGETENLWLREHVAGKQTARPYTVMAIMHNAPAAHLSIQHQILGPVMTHSSACASSGAAIGDAFLAIRDGRVDVALAGGAEAPLLAGMLGAWDGLRALAPVDAEGVGRSCKPFSRQRKGLVLGEGAAFVMLESESHATKRGANILCELSGYGTAADGRYIAAPHARGQVAALSAALADAGIAPVDLDYVNAHATGTPGGDVVEAEALGQVLGPEIERVPVSATKSVHGHLLGAASAIEFVVTALAIQHSFLPATANLDDPDPECHLHHVACAPVRGVKIRHALSLSAGFGGTNTALCVSRWQCPSS